MITNDQTQIQSGDATQWQSENTVPGTAANEAPADNRWKLITMGGAAGILVGAGALYAGTAIAGNTSDNEVAGLDKDGEEVVTLDAPEGAVDAAAAVSATAAPDAAAPDAAAPAAPASAGTTINVNVNIDPAATGQVTAEVKTEEAATPAADDKSVLYSQVGHVEIYSEAPIAHSVDDHMTFSEAFAAARAEVGPGGVFHYRGGDYGTYYADEWQAMSKEEHEMYADSVHPEVPADKLDVPADNPADITINVQINGQDIHTVVDDKLPEPETEVEVEDEGMEVSFEGYAQVTTPDGEQVNVLGMTVDGDEVAFIDVDGDNQFDYALSDVNGDGELQQGELVDLSTGEAVNLEDLQLGMDDPTLTADAGDIDLGGDFINDADVQLV